MKDKLAPWCTSYFQRCRWFAARNVTLVDQSGHLLTHPIPAVATLMTRAIVFATMWESRIQRRIEAILVAYRRER
ncbi:hypothetical protein KCP73_01280 [Salmonella enterica subsp. enterica]|nr:hypothetical protein KCP73_01280 [Salmonella enterica subsp. enterica]